jgi:amino acid transporter
LLGLRQAIAIIVGIVIGAGIFKAPSMVAGMAGSTTWMFVAWLLGGLVSLIGALCYAELATAYPHPGGDYHFLRRAYGNNVSFLFAWARFSVITTGSIALLAFVFGDYLSQGARFRPTQRVGLCRGGHHRPHRRQPAGDQGRRCGTDLAHVPRSGGGCC